MIEPTVLPNDITALRIIAARVAARSPGNLPNLDAPTGPRPSFSMTPLENIRAQQAVAPLDDSRRAARDTTPGTFDTRSESMGPGAARTALVDRFL